MKLFLISCRSSCGTYFQPYLQSVTVVAKDQKHAIEICEEWQKENHSFEKKELKNMRITEIQQDLSPGVVDFVVESDY
jgi:hypothetical protein